MHFFYTLICMSKIFRYLYTEDFSAEEKTASKFHYQCYYHLQQEYQHNLRFYLIFLYSVIRASAYKTHQSPS